MNEIEDQLRSYAQQLRSQGISRDEARRLLQERETSLRSAPTPPTPAAPRERGLTASQRARLAGQGALFGFGEELEGLARGAAAILPGGRSPGEAYRETVEGARRDIREAYRRAPAQAFATEMGAAFAPALAAAPFTAGGSLAAGAARAAAAAPRAAQAARAVRGLSRASAARPIVGGGVEGAISGAGAAEGGLGTRALGATVGGVLGAGTGGAFTAGGALVRRGRDVASNIRLQRQAAELSAQSRAQGIPMSESEAFSILVSQQKPEIPTRAATERISEALLEQGIEPSRAGAFARPGQTVMELGSPSSEISALQAGMLPGSAAATPIQRVARGVSVAGGEPAERIRSTVAERLIGSPGRVRSAIEREVSTARSPYLATMEALEGARRANANELYEVAYQQAVPVNKVSSFISMPENINWFVNTYRDAQNLAAREVAAGVDGAIELPNIFQYVKTKSGGQVLKPVKGASLPVKAADYIQRVVRDRVDRGFAGGTIGRQEARVLKAELENFLSTVDEAVPDFQQARRMYRSDSANLDAQRAAFEGGPVMIGNREINLRRFMEERPEAVRRFLSSSQVSSAEKQSYIGAALESLIERAERTASGRDVTRAMLSNESMAQKIRLLMGSEENFERFLMEIMPERGLKSLEARVLGGSSTAEKAADLSRARALETGASLAGGATQLAARIFAGAVEEAERRFTKMARGRAERALTSQMLTMSPEAFESFYRGVYRPMVERQPSLAETLSQATRRATGGQLARTAGRSF